ncbi:hypothetical protein COO60DRAFT_76033 [Scenedesmus sp. NREL 46B-D3]|nr:hypothetical protein COO60DRAFT_76033 [Scenedesmus sp. NREL 46B-D3]
MFVCAGGSLAHTCSSAYAPCGCTRPVFPRQPVLLALLACLFGRAVFSGDRGRQRAVASLDVPAPTIRTHAGARHRRRWTAPCGLLCFVEQSGRGFKLKLLQGNFLWPACLLIPRAVCVQVSCASLSCWRLRLAEPVDLVRAAAQGLQACFRLLSVVVDPLWWRVS